MLGRWEVNGATPSAGVLGCWGAGVLGHDGHLCWVTTQDAHPNGFTVKYSFPFYIGKGEDEYRIWCCNKYAFHHSPLRLVSGRAGVPLNTCLC